MVNMLSEVLGIKKTDIIDALQGVLNQASY